MRVLDAHAHLWDAARTGQTWLAGTDLPRVQTLADHPFLGGASSLAAPWLAEEGWEAAGVVVVEGDPGAGKDNAEAQLVAEAAGAHPGVVRGYVPPLRLSEIAAGDRTPEGPGWAAVRDNCQGLGPDYLRSAAFRQGLAVYAGWGLPLELCLHRTQLGALAEALQELDEPLAVILDHAGKPPLGEAPGAQGTLGGDALAWERDLRRLAADPRVRVKLSGLYAEAPQGATLPERRRLARPFLERTVEAFGLDRSVFGLDCPVAVRSADEARAWIEDVLAVTGPDAGVFAENAERVYGLEPSLGVSPTPREKADLP